MKVPILGDCHFGARGNSQFFLNSCADFFDNVFFPYMDQHNLKTFIQPGDLMESRKAVGMMAHHQLRTKLLEPCEDRGIRGYFLPGNHDILHNNTSHYNWLNELIPTKQYPHAVVIHTPTILDFNGCEIDMIPWINDENSEKSLRFIKSSTSKVCVGHFDIVGFEMVSGVLCANGLDRKIFDHYDLVLSGHYHNYSHQGNITYMGCPYAFTWNDYGVRKGFMVLDTETLELEYVENPRTDFHKINYDDTDRTYDDVDLSLYENGFVKLIVEKTNDPKMFAEFARKLGEVAYMVDPINLQEIIPDLEGVDLQVDSSLSLLVAAVDEMEMTTSKANIKSKIYDINKEAEEQMVF